MTEDAVSFSLSDGELTVRDEAGSGEVVVDVDGATSVTPATDAWFDVPVDAAVSVETSSMEVQGAPATQLRRVDGENYGSLTGGTFSIDGETYVDITTAMKLLVYVDGEMTGRFVGDAENPDSLLLTFDDPTRIVVGARSFHDSPIATMTVTDDPEDLMTAASHLGSAIKEWSAERSWPTLRGHPPAIEAGDELDVPDCLSVPDTDVTVAVPPNTADVLRVTPLAYYFGADVVSGDRAELRLGTQHVEPLGAGAELEQSVDDLLAHAIVLDSLVRIDGYYSLPRYEYEEIAPELPFYPPELYDEPIHRQLLEYLEVSFETIRPYMPTWHAVGTLRPTAAAAEAVPYLLSTLARVHVTPDGVPRQSPPDTGKPLDLSPSPAVPHRTAALPTPARERAAEHEERRSGDASVLFVGWEAPYGAGFTTVDWSRFKIDATPTATYRPSVTRAELRSLLAEEYAHVHYGNRVTEEGFVCSDGVLAFEDCPDGSVGAISFVWGQRTTAALTDLLDTVSVACLTDEQLSIEEAQELAVYLVLGRSVASSARLTGIDAVRYLGDALLPVAHRPVGYCPTVFQVERADDKFHVSTVLDTNERDLIGRVSTSRFQELSDRFQLSGTSVCIPEPVSGDELADMLTVDGIFRFDWRTESERDPALSAPDDLLTK
ncbi:MULTISPECIES: hypothetical protein [Halolamina]|uniref:Uncharacterized protein n=1 Tax=Halolamina pelagica TaxID=699431 RepID=A0A1I5PKA9_9EURY|nr:MULTISPECIES: hypothetical protein [Halolamina]NHX34859.1 hypothetical protein [Halolamina sp. R1-12]SFP34443.1 hypothetical protein SAMN05216277_10314 [Halolamina pelagica]